MSRRIERDNLVNNIYKDYPHRYTEPTIITDDGHKTYHLCKQCQCCYSLDGNYCCIRNLSLMYVKSITVSNNKYYLICESVETLLQEIYPNKFTEPFIIGEDDGQRYYLCKRCKCCYSPDGLCCAVSMYKSIYERYAIKNKNTNNS